MKEDLLYLVVETSLHAGTGSDVGPVDLPIQREVHSELPRIQASGVKGALRDAYARCDGEHAEALFGPARPKTGDDHFAGCVTFSDARLLLFPARVLGSMFAWFTCPYVLARFARDGGGGPQFAMFESQRGLLHVAVADGQPGFTYKDGKDERVAVGDIAYEARREKAVGGLAAVLADRLYGSQDYLGRKLKTALCVMHDEDFAELTRTKTEVVTRVRLDRDVKTVERGALWTEESLPAETVLYSVIGAMAPRKRANRAPGLETTEDVLLHVREKMTGRCQFGGGETTGHGMVRLVWDQQFCSGGKA